VVATRGTVEAAVFLTVPFFLQALLALETVSLDALLILFAYTPVAVGGLGALLFSSLPPSLFLTLLPVFPPFLYLPLSLLHPSPISSRVGFPPSSIGTALSLSGLLAVSFQLLLFPPLQRYFGTVRLYRGLMSLWPLVFALFPVMGWFARRENQAGVWGAMVVFLGLKSM
jgi:hypothetical protein